MDGLSPAGQIPEALSAFLVVLVPQLVSLPIPALVRALNAATMILPQGSLFLASIAACSTVVAAAGDASSRPRGVGPECEYTDCGAGPTHPSHMHTISLISVLPLVTRTRLRSNGEVT